MKFITKAGLAVENAIPESRIPDLFLNPEIPGLEPSNPGISGLTTSYIFM
jgi:hypothetical protein